MHMNYACYARQHEPRRELCPIHALRMQTFSLSSVLTCNDFGHVSHQPQSLTPRDSLWPKDAVSVYDYPVFHVFLSGSVH